MLALIVFLLFIAPMSREEAPTGLYDGVVPDELVHDLVEELSTSWRMLGRRLGLSEGLLKNINSENPRVVEKGVAMFEEWKNRKSNAATVQALREGLEKIGRLDLSENVRGMWYIYLLYFSWLSI